MTQSILRMNIYISIIGVAFTTVWSGSSSSAGKSTTWSTSGAHSSRNPSRTARARLPLAFTHSSTFASAVDIAESDAALSAMDAKEMGIVTENIQIPLKVRVEQTRVSC
jgi:hypothetical protein